MTDFELMQFAMEFRKGILGTRPSNWMCAAISRPLASLLRLHDVDCKDVETDLGFCNHVWIKLSDGRALDPTADQFNEQFSLNYPAVYLGNPLNIHGAIKS